MSGADWTVAGLWLAVVASGFYHGVNPGMGWPLAVSAGLMERSSRALFMALWPLWAGHLLAMLLVILPFALLVTLVEWQRPIQSGASLLGELAGILEVPCEEFHYVILDFHAAVSGGTAPRPGTDASDVRWVPLKEVARMDCTPRFVETMTAWKVLTDDE